MTMHGTDADENARLCTFTIRTESDHYVLADRETGTWGEAQERAAKLANEHATSMTLIASTGGETQFFTVYPDSWLDNPVQAG